MRPIDHLAAFLGVSPALATVLILLGGVAIAYGIFWACLELSRTPDPEGSKRTEPERWR